MRIVTLLMLAGAMLLAGCETDVPTEPATMTTDADKAGGNRPQWYTPGAGNWMAATS